MLSLRFDSLLVSFSGESTFDYDEQSAFFFDTTNVSFDAAVVSFDAGRGHGRNEALRFDAATTFDTTHEKFDEV